MNAKHVLELSDSEFRVWVRNNIPDAKVSALKARDGTMKHYLRGFGVGLIGAAIMLALILLGHWGQ